MQGRQPACNWISSGLWLLECPSYLYDLETAEKLLLHQNLRHRLERWLNSKEHPLLLQRTWVWFPDRTASGSSQPSSSVLGDLTVLLASVGPFTDKQLKILRQSIPHRHINKKVCMLKNPWLHSSVAGSVDCCRWLWEPWKEDISVLEPLTPFRVFFMSFNNYLGSYLWNMPPNSKTFLQNPQWKSHCPTALTSIPLQSRDSVLC